MTTAALTATAGMNAGGYVLLGVLALAGVSLARKEDPLLLALRLLVLARAAGLLAREMAAGAWARRGRWEDCKYWAARLPGHRASR
jgi:hypothetical protein